MELHLELGCLWWRNYILLLVAFVGANGQTLFHDLFGSAALFVDRGLKVRLLLRELGFCIHMSGSIDDMPAV